LASDTSLIASLIAAGASLGAAAAAWFGNYYGANAETRRRQLEHQLERRRERKEAYLKAIDLVTDWQWREQYDPDFDILKDFTILFVRSATRIRLYGSPVSIAAVDEIQEGLHKLNEANEKQNEGAGTAAYKAIGIALDHLVIAARADVGSQDDDKVPNVPFRQGGGPRA
jgi:hypothetical protein